MENFRKRGALLVTVPSLQESLDALQVKKHTHTNTHIFSGAKEDYHFLFFRRCCSLAGWRSFLWTMTFTWARTQTLMLCDRSTCTESSDLDLSRDWTGF